MADVSFLSNICSVNTKHIPTLDLYIFKKIGCAKCQCIHLTLHRRLKQMFSVVSLLTYLCLCQVSISEHLKQLTDAQRDFGLHGKNPPHTYSTCAPHTDSQNSSVSCFFNECLLMESSLQQTSIYCILVYFFSI